MVVWIFVFLIIWLTFLTFVVLANNTHYKRLVKISSKQDLQEVLEKLLDRIEVDKDSINKLNDQIKKLEKEEELHVQKVGLVRFNPFSDTGGDQSFILALLNKNNTGVLISSLHARSTTRWYAKRIINGKSKDVQLSKEEEKAILGADKIKL
ncbi:DUF4446 family protein [Candidatus Gottesmanbacteria bacterium]|nr:DUF4446 family protein [Candidatus Gottesmanbacteria bacterium]